MEIDISMNFFIYFGVLTSPLPQKNLNTKNYFPISQLGIGQPKRTTDFQDLEKLTGKYGTITSSLILNCIQNQTVLYLHNSHSKKAEVLWTAATMNMEKLQGRYIFSTVLLGVIESPLHKNKSLKRIFCLTKNVKLI